MGENTSGHIGFEKEACKTKEVRIVETGFRPSDSFKC